jgi:hypothetical protein
VLKADNLTTILYCCHESGNLNFPEPSGPLLACDGIALTSFTIKDMRQRVAHFGLVRMKGFILGRLAFGRKEANLLKFEPKIKHETDT